MKFSASVIIPTYNRVPFLSFAVDSALSQSLEPCEVIVVDDGSTDETSELMKMQYNNNRRVRYIRFDENRGPGFARAMAALMATGDFLAFLDSDDVWNFDHLEVASKVFTSNPDAVAVLMQRGSIDNSGKVITDVVYERYTGAVSDALMKRIIFHPSRLVVRTEAWRELWKSTSPEELSLRFGEDYLVGVALLHTYKDNVIVSPERTVWMRVHDNQSFYSVMVLKENLLKAVDKIFTMFPDLLPMKKKIKAANLYHAAYFLWRSGNWNEAWRSWVEGFASYPAGIALKDSWIALSRLLLPPGTRRLLRKN